MRKFPTLMTGLLKSRNPEKIQRKYIFWFANQMSLARAINSFVDFLL